MNVDPILIDVRGFLDRKEAKERGIYDQTL